MNIRTKNGVRTIKLDVAERRVIEKFRDLVNELSLYAKHLEPLSVQVQRGVINKINEEGAFDPSAPPSGKEESQ